MTARQQWAIVATIIVLVAGALFAGTRFLGAELHPIVAGARAPTFHAVTVDSTPRPRTLADYKGQVVVLNIWATWCPPCRDEMPSMERLYQAMGPKGLKVVAVSVDDPGKAQAIRDFRDEYKLNFEILHDPSFEIKRDYQTTGVPETFIIGADGVIRKKVIAAADWSSPANQALVASLLAEAGPSPANDAADVRPVPVAPAARP